MATWRTPRVWGWRSGPPSLVPLSHFITKGAGDPLKAKLKSLPCQWLRGWERHPLRPRLQVRFLDTGLGWASISGWGTCRRQPVTFLSPFLSLKVSNGIKNL